MTCGSGMQRCELAEARPQWRIPPDPEPVTWATLVAIEPRLRALLAQARQVQDDGHGTWFCQLVPFYAYFKPALLPLVGHGARTRSLRTEACYDCAYDVVLHALAPCRGRCPCTW